MEGRLALLAKQQKPKLMAVAVKDQIVWSIGNTPQMQLVDEEGCIIESLTRGLGVDSPFLWRTGGGAHRSARMQRRGGLALGKKWGRLRFADFS